MTSPAASHGKTKVGPPKGSVPLPLNECQYATAKRRCSSMVFPAITFFASYQRYASGLSVSGPSYEIFPIPVKYSRFPIIVFLISCLIALSVQSVLKAELLIQMLFPCLIPRFVVRAPLRCDGC